MRRSEDVESVGCGGFWPDTGRFAFLTASTLRPLAIAFCLGPAAVKTSSGNQLDNIYLSTLTIFHTPEESELAAASPMNSSSAVS